MLGHQKSLKKPVFVPTIKLIIHNYFEHNVGSNAAGLAYYLLFALFPLLIFISNLLGIMDLEINSILQFLGRILPTNVLELVQNYLEYVTNSSSHILLWFSLFFSIWFPMRATKVLMDGVRQAYHLGNPKRPVLYTIRRLIYSVVFPLAIELTLLLSTLGKQVLIFISDLLPENILEFSNSFLGLWQYLRFIPVALLMFVALGTLYSMALEERQPVKFIMPGIIGALVSWMIVSIGFSFYVENFANYSVIYGTLGAVIVLLMWLYITAIILILGAELNAALMRVRHENK